MGVAPAACRAERYGGSDRWLYSVSVEVGSGMAMRTVMEEIV
jgi:hypothetical protein